MADFNDISDLLQWIKGSRIARLSITARDLQLSMHNEIDVAKAGADPNAQTPATVEVRAPAAGRFIRAVEPGAELDLDTVIGTVQLVQTRRPVFAGTIGYLASFQADAEAAVAYGDVVALVCPKDAPC